MKAAAAAGEASGGGSNPVAKAKAAAGGGRKGRRVRALLRHNAPAINAVVQEAPPLSTEVLQDMIQEAGGHGAASPVTLARAAHW